MLIIAIPKSASTSLLHTLGQVHDVKSQQDFENVKENPIPNNFELIGKYHSDCRELLQSNIEKWTVTNQFYKQHAPPTKNNFELLHHSKKVILLRDPEDIILAYRRAENMGVHGIRTEFEGCGTEDDWLDRAKKIGLYAELKSFYDGWISVSTDKYLVNFNDLVSNEKKVLKNVSEYYDLQIDNNQLNNLKLRKHRYSRYNGIQKYMYIAIRRLKKIFAIF